MAYGIDDTGFVLKRLSNILSDINVALAKITDPKTDQTLYLSDENDPLVNIRDSIGDQLSVCWEQLQLAYNQFDPLKATGAGLSGLVQLNGITRKPGVYSSVELSMTGTPNLYIQPGKQVSTYDGTVSFTLPAWTFDSSGNSTVVGQCTEYGPFEAESGDVTKIDTPVPGWDTCTNADSATVGSYEETDTELRRRQQLSTEKTGRGTVEDMYSNISSLDGVTWCRVYQNTTLETDSRGIPGKSIAVVVLGGGDEEIAQTIHDQSPALCGYYGDTTVNITDSQEISYGVSFVRPAQVPIYLTIQLKVINATVWPVDAESTIKQAIVDYSLLGAYSLGITEGYTQEGYAPGQSVYVSELYVPINSVPGAQIVSCFVGKTSEPESPYVTIEWDEICAFDQDNISITMV